MAEPLSDEALAELDELCKNPLQCAVWFPAFRERLRRADADRGTNLDVLGRTQVENASLREALDAWHTYAHAALDAGYMKSHPGNEIPWGLRDAAAPRTEQPERDTMTEGGG